MNLEVMAIGIMALVIGLMVVEYLRLRGELGRMRSEEGRIRERARDRAERVVEEAKDKAVEMVREAEVLSVKQAEGLERRLKRAARENMQAYEEVLKRMTGKIATETWGEVRDFKKTLGAGTVEMEKAVAERIGEEMEKARTEIEDYKREKKTQLDEKAVEIVKELGKKVLAKVIPAEEHKKLILEALKEVEADYGF